MKKVLVIAHFCGEFDGSGNNRFNYLVDKLSQEKNIKVELVTSSFSHVNKIQRNIISDTKKDYEITMLKEPSYKKNVSLKRFYSHYRISKNLEKYLNEIETPDVIYCAVPSLDIALVAAKYCKEKKIKYIIDIQDLWPEAFKLIFNIPILSNILFYPMKRMAAKIYKSADGIVAVSETYLKEALNYNEDIREKEVVFLGTNLEEFDRLSIKNKYPNKNKAEIWLAYAGTLGHSYDLTTVIKSLKILKDRNIKNVRMIVMGDGPLRYKFEELSRKYKVKVDFMGRLPYENMVGILSVCDIALNPISKGAAQSIINKHGDYAAAGLPVINTQESEEYKLLVDNYNMGLNSINNNPHDLSEKIMLLINNDQLREKMSKNSRLLAEDKFDRANTYKLIIDMIKKEFINE